MEDPKVTPSAPPDDSTGVATVLAAAAAAALPAISPSRTLPPTYQQQSENADYNNNKNNASNQVCRICLEDDARETMIAPCKCKGGSKWVHRDCLDEWRTQEPDRAFARCTECLFEYYLQPVYREEEEEGRTNPHHHRRRWIFCAFVSRDVCLGTLLLQIVIVGLGALVWAVDVNMALPQTWPVLAEHPVSMYYLLGWLMLLVLMGLYGGIVMCRNGCSLERSLPQVGPPTPSGVTQQRTAMVPTGAAPMAKNNQTMYTDRAITATTTSMPAKNQDYHSSSVEYYRRARFHRRQRRRRGCGRRQRGCCHRNVCTDCCYYGCYDCHPLFIYDIRNCGCCCCYDEGGRSGGGGGGDCCDGTCCGSNSGNNNDCGDGAHILLVLLLVVAVILAIIGFFVGMAITVVAFQRVVQRHIHLLQKRQLVQEFQVMDLSGYYLDQPLPPAPLEEDLEDNMLRHPLPSAPAMPEEDVAYLKKMGLLDD